MPSSVEKIVGNAPEGEKEKILQGLDERFDDQEFSNLEDKEREKTPEELKVINLANQATNELRRKYGLEDFDVPAENIHVINESAWPEDFNGSAVYSVRLQTVAARETKSSISFFKKIVHEMTHFKSYNSMQLTHEGEPRLKGYRLGLTVVARDGRKIYLKNLNEAITEEIAKEITLANSKNLLFKKDVKQTKDIVGHYGDAVTEDGTPLFGEDTVYAELLDDTTWRDAIGRMFGRERSRRLGAEFFTYPRERKVLKELIDKLFARNIDKFASAIEVSDLFRRSMMTGNILPLGKLIDGTFGAGTLRKIGELDSDIDAQEEFIKSL